MGILIINLHVAAVVYCFMLPDTTLLKEFIHFHYNSLYQWNDIFVLGLHLVGPWTLDHPTAFNTSQVRLVEGDTTFDLGPRMTSEGKYQIQATVLFDCLKKNVKNHRKTVTVKLQRVGKSGKSPTTVYIYKHRVRRHSKPCFVISFSVMADLRINDRIRLLSDGDVSEKKYATVFSMEKLM